MESMFLFDKEDQDQWAPGTALSGFQAKGMPRHMPPYQLDIHQID
jgi:hypothetical protein